MFSITKQQELIDQARDRLAREEREREIREQAWGEGYLAGKAMKPFDSRTHAKNPYRKAN